MDVLAEQWRIPIVQLRKGLVDMKIVSVLPRDKAQRYGVMPMFKVEETLTIATPPRSTLAARPGRPGKPHPVSCPACPVPCRRHPPLLEYYGEQVHAGG